MVTGRRFRFRNYAKKCGLAGEKKRAADGWTVGREPGVGTRSALRQRPGPEWLDCLRGGERSRGRGEDRDDILA